LKAMFFLKQKKIKPLMNEKKKFSTTIKVTKKDLHRNGTNK
jgi:hypothetical protein